MSNIVIFPIKTHSERVPGKNFLSLNDGRKMYQTTTMAALNSGAFNNVVIDTDSDEIKEWASANRITWITRRPDLALNSANGNNLLRHHIETFPGYDYYWQGFVTVPWISSKTISDLVYRLTTSNIHDGLITGRLHYGFFWVDGRPVSFRPDMLPRSQDLTPTFQEVSGFFGISYNGFQETRCRYGTTPIFYEIPKHEDLEIDWPFDAEELRKNPPQLAPKL
jgi:N-acylneuraminate cytidylyltransferase